MENNRAERITQAKETLELAEQDLKYAVVAAVLDGASWSEIGELLGTSKQTAHNRYAKSVDVYARVESGELEPEAEAREKRMSLIYNPEPLLVYNQHYSFGYRRALFQEPTHQNVKDLFSDSEDR